MAQFQIRKDEESQRWRWRLVDDDARVIARSAYSQPTKGECLTSLNEARRLMLDPDVAIETQTSLPGDSRWRAISPTGEVGEPVRDDTPDYDEGETGPPEVADPPRGSA
jgi:hypothetical protein